MSSTRLRRILTPVAVAAMGLGLVVTSLTAGSASASTTPKGASDGVTAHSITIGGTEPLTGIASSGYNEVSQAAKAVFLWVNHHASMHKYVYGRTINYNIIDDCYATPGFGCTGNPNELHDTDALINTPVFATFGSLGTPTQAPMRPVLKAAGVPQLLVNSPSIDFNCGVAHPRGTTYSQAGGCGLAKGAKESTVYPNTFGFQTSYPAESMILGQYIAHNYAGKKVCFLGQDDDFGHDGQAGLTYEGIHTAVVRYYSVTNLVISGAASITPYIKAFKSASCTLVYLDTIPGATAAALGNAAALSYAPQWVISSVGSDPQTLAGGSLLGSAGAGLELGAISFAPLPTTTDSNPWNAWDHLVLKADPQPKYWGTVTNSTLLNGNEAIGIAEGVAFVEALHAAGKNFTRASFVADLLKGTFQTPGLTPLKYSAANHQGLIGGYVSVVSATGVTTGATSPAKGVDGKKAVYVTTGTKGARVTLSRRVSTTVPLWLR
jgi:ABC-type branched-subunit amino acid transport system substrate-binding protein